MLAAATGLAISPLCHKTLEYARGEVHVNTAESSHALIRRGLIGIYQNVSRDYLHRYLWQLDFLWNNRQMNDGERTVAAIQGAEGKRLMYKDPIAQQQEYTENREKKEGEQFEPFQEKAARKGKAGTERRTAHTRRRLGNARDEVLREEEAASRLAKIMGTSRLEPAQGGAGPWFLALVN